MLRYLLPLAYLTALSTGASTQYQKIDIEDKDYWMSMASAKLGEVLERRQRNVPAKNVIVFVGDGMGLATITAGRIYKGGESHVLSFEKFPATGLSKTYNTDNMVSDSASTATAMFCGVKTNQHVLGLDSTAPYNTCNSEANKKASVSSYMTWAQEVGKDTGIVTTTRITHATPGATYAHINNRDWECDSAIPSQDAQCVKDIARQLVEEAPGKNFKVILGGGRSEMGDGEKRGSCVRSDRKNLASEWKRNRRNSEYVTTADELARVDVKNTEYLMGLFSPDHLNYTKEEKPERPSLKLMTETAIRMLQKNKNGFALMVEGGRIDHGHHENMAQLALSELVDMDEAVQAAVSMTDPDDTLIIITADHSHTMTINGHPRRGDDVLGLANNKSNSFYETLTYANGPGFTYHHLKEKQDNCHENCDELTKESANSWRDIRKEQKERQNIYYRHLASVYLDQETHGGEDVPIYASGPMSHLLVGVHEENYIASVISYACCMGPEAHRCKRGHQSSSAPSSFNEIIPFYAILLTVLKSIV